MNKKIVYIIICIILILVILFLMKNNGGNNISNEVLTENIIEENVLNEEENIIDENTTIVENVINNVAIEENNTVQTIQNAIVQDNLISSPEKNAYESEKDLGSTSKKQEAINMVKEYWGEDNTVTFSCDSVTSNGEYIIAVVSKNTASVSGYFRVNLEKKTVEVDY